MTIMDTSKVLQSTNIKEPLTGLKKHVINTWNLRKKPRGEKSGRGSQVTVPNMALSINTILQRFSRGQSLPQTREPIYSEEDYSELQKMDKIDKVDLLHQTKSFIKETRKQKETPQTQKTTNTASDHKEPATDGSEPVTQL